MLQGCPYLRFVLETCLWGGNNSLTWWLTSPNACVSCFAVSSSFCAISVVSLRDYPCHRPVRVVSLAAQAAAVVQPVRRHGEMLRLISRRQFCLNIWLFRNSCPVEEVNQKISSVTSYLQKFMSLIPQQHKLRELGMLPRFERDKKMWFSQRAILWLT